MKKLSKSKLKLQLKPLITKSILKSIRYTNKLYKKLCKNKFDNKLKLQEYKTYRNKLTKIRTISKKLYYEKRLQNCCNNSSETWKVINHITKRKKKDNGFPHILKVNEKTLNNQIDIVSNFNLHFLNIEKKICFKSGNRLNFSIHSIKKSSNSFVWSDVEKMK